MVEKPKLSEVLAWSGPQIADFLSGIYEHSSWVAQELVEQSDGSTSCKLDRISTIGELANAMKQIVDDSSTEQKLALLRAHPDLAAKVESMRSLTTSSQEEQSSAGLQSLTPEERQKFTTLNTAYKTKFQFPFILAVRNATKYTVLAAMEGRIQNASHVEMASALTQVHKIAWMRLLAAIDVDNRKGFLTCHVLDTANGCPAANMRIHLHRLSPSDKAGFIEEFFTNNDGRLPNGPALKGDDQFIVGTYEWTFFVADYFASKGTFVSGVPFLDQVPLRFGLDDPDEHYHVPLLVSPWSYSTYRGS